MADDDDEALDAPDFEIPNAADPKRQRRQHDKAAREAREAREFWQTIFAHPTGRREMWRILQMGHAFEEQFAADGSPHKDFVLAGEQRLATRLYRDWLALDLEGVIRMTRDGTEGKL